MVSELISEGDIPDLVESALVSGHEDVAVQPKPVPVPDVREAREAREPASGSWEASTSSRSYSMNCVSHGRRAGRRP